MRYTLQDTGLPGAAVEQGIPYDVRTRSWFQHAVTQGKPAWYPIYKYQSYDGLGVGLSAPVYGKGGQLQAVVAADTTDPAAIAGNINTTKTPPVQTSKIASADSG